MPQLSLDLIEDLANCLLEFVESRRPGAEQGKKRKEKPAAASQVKVHSKVGGNFGEEQVCRIIGQSSSTLRRWIKAKYFPAPSKKIGRANFWSAAHIKAWDVWRADKEYRAKIGNWRDWKSSTGSTEVCPYCEG